MDNPSHPLTDDHLVMIKDAMARLADADHMITKAKMAGIAVDEQQKQVHELRNKLRQIGHAYFPGKLT
jgi:hypothetical protein